LAAITGFPLLVTDDQYSDSPVYDAIHGRVLEYSERMDSSAT
jgi:hypothetical protein